MQKKLLPSQRFFLRIFINIFTTMIDSILTRRSIRRYLKKQVSDDKVAQIVKCGINAPSALNMQPWQVRVVRTPEILDALNTAFVDWAKDKNLPGSASRAQEEGFCVFHHAPTLIVVAADTSNPYAEGDCGMFAQNIQLAAHALGVGSCVIGSMAKIINESPTIRKELLKLDEDFKVLFGIALGYADEKPEPKHRDVTKVEWL